MSLMQKLISWQQETARRSHLEPYMILQFNTTKEIAPEHIKDYVAVNQFMK
jgi:ribonuclease D